MLRESMAESDRYVIGQNIHLKAAQLLGRLDSWFEEQFIWIDEVLAEAKKTLAT